MKLGSVCRRSPISQLGFLLPLHHDALFQQPGNGLLVQPSLLQGSHRVLAHLGKRQNLRHPGCPRQSGCWRRLWSAAGGIWDESVWAPIVRVLGRLVKLQDRLDAGVQLWEYFWPLAPGPRLEGFLERLSHLGLVIHLGHFGSINVQPWQSKWKIDRCHTGLKSECSKDSLVGRQKPQLGSRGNTQVGVSNVMQWRDFNKFKVYNRTKNAWVQLLRLRASPFGFESWFCIFPLSSLFFCTIS